MNIRSGQVTLNNFTKNNKTRLEREVRKIEPELPEGWRAIEIGRVVKGFRSGFACSKKYAKESGIPHLRPNNIGFYGELNLSQLVFLPAEMVDLSKYSLKEGDVLFNNTNSKELVGRASLVKQNLECGFSNHITRLRVNKELITSEWLVHCINYLWLEGFFLKLCRKWIGQAGVNTKMLKSTIIPLPPLEEQRRLVVSIEEIMSRIGQARKLREEALKDTEAIMQSALHQIFSKAEEKRWSWKKLTDVCIRITDGTHKTPKYVEKGVPFLSVKNIKETGFVLDDVKYITLEEHLELTKRWKPQKGDVLYTKIGTTGIAKVVDIDLEFSIFVSVALLRPNRDMIDPYYLQTVLNSPIAREQAYKFTRGAANQNLVLKDLKKIEIPVPSLEEQKQIVMYTSKLQEKVLILKKYQEENKRKIEEITQAVLKEAFSGQL